MAPAGRILVVDDDLVVCAGIARLLQRHGYDVDTASGGEPALEKIRDARYDVLLVDIMMPQMNGLDLLARLQGEQTTARAIVITGLGAARHAVEAFRVGAFDFVKKPFTSDELISAVRRAASSEAGKCATLPVPEQPSTYRLGSHSWVRLVERGRAMIGIQECFQRTAGKFVSVDLPNEGDELSQGELCARLRSEGGPVYSVWSPITGRVVEVNLDLLQNPAVANSQPYDSWFVRVFPASFEEEAAALIPPPLAP